MKYFQAVNTGKGFVTHAENESAHISGYPANIWVTINTTWPSRVNATEYTKTEAQAFINTELDGELDDDGNQVVVTLP